MCMCVSVCATDKTKIAPVWRAQCWARVLMGAHMAGVFQASCTAWLYTFVSFASWPVFCANTPLCAIVVFTMFESTLHARTLFHPFPPSSTSPTSSCLYLGPRSSYCTSSSARNSLLKILFACVRTLVHSLHPRRGSRR